MKTRHLLAALVLPAVFSACSQDELVTDNTEKEVVGTPIGYLEFTASRGSDATTRLGDSGWEAGDKIGMGWISDGANLSATANLFSNHPLYYNTTNGSFKSETMIYEGLYIASFPFQETSKIAPLVFDLKKQQSEDNLYSKRWYVSKEFFTLNEKSAGLGNATSINLVPLTNLVKLNIKLAEGAGVPEDFKVTGVKLKDGGSSHLMQDLKLISNNGAVASPNSTLADAAWEAGTGTVNNGTILVQVGKEGVGTAIGKDGLDVYIQMGKFSASDDTKLAIETNYGEASVTAGGSSVSWSSTDLSQTKADVASFEAAIQGAAGKAASASKVYGQNVSINVTLDAASIKASSTITCQADLEKYVNTLEKLGKLDAPATVTFKQSEHGVVAADGDVIITDISPLNKIKGAITFANDADNAPTEVYIAGELALQAAVGGNDVTFQVLNGDTLTVSKDLDLKGTLLTVNAGATLVNKAKIAATGSTKGITIAAGVVAAGQKPAIPAGLYISEDGASLNMSGSAAFTNNGAIEWKGGTLPDTAGKVYANIATPTDLVKASVAFAAATSGDNEVVIADDLVVATQLSTTTFAGIKKMTIKGEVTFNLGLASTFVFSALTAIHVESGSFNLAGGDQGTTADSFYAFTAGNCTLTLDADTELNVAAGAKLDLGSGSVVCNGATVVNNGWIVGDGQSGTPTSWTGSMVGTNPKAAK